MTLLHVTYRDESSAKKAVTRSETRGMTLKKVELKVEIIIRSFTGALRLGYIILNMQTT